MKNKFPFSPSLCGTHEKVSYFVYLFEGLLVQFHGGYDLLHLAQNHVQVLVVRLGRFQTKYRERESGGRRFGSRADGLSARGCFST